MNARTNEDGRLRSIGMGRRVDAHSASRRVANERRLRNGVAGGLSVHIWRSYVRRRVRGRVRFPRGSRVMSRPLIACVCGGCGARYSTGRGRQKGEGRQEKEGKQGAQVQAGAQTCGAACALARARTQLKAEEDMRTKHVPLVTDQVHHRHRLCLLAMLASGSGVGGSVLQSA
eukprot:1107777-Prorocentrum_minimum.AAC.4